MASLTDSAAATELEEAMAPLLLKVTDVKKCEGALTLTLTLTLTRQVTDVKKCEGAASVQSSRGKVTHIY